MKRKLNKWLSGVLAACVLFTTVPVYAINDVSGSETSTEVVETSEETQSSEIETSSAEETVQESSESTESSEITSEQTSEIADEMLNISPMNLGDQEEPSTDNWELSTVFYDSTVDNGKTPLTSIDWDASDGGYGVGETRVITVQINYKNTNAVTTYQPGDLEISIPNLIYNTSRTTGSQRPLRAQWNTNVIVGANDSTHTNYDWDFTTDSEPTSSQKTYSFTNANIIEEKSNFEGSIQIVYTITPTDETYDNVYSDGWDGGSLELYQDECTHTLNIDLQADLSFPSDENISKNLASNKINFNYTRTYIHPWKKPSIDFLKKAEKITSYDRLGENPENYTWVKYTFNRGDYSRSYFPYISMRKETSVIYDSFPSTCKVLLPSGETLLPIDETIELPSGEVISSSDTEKLYALPYDIGSTIYVGYSKDIFNEDAGNMVFTNTAYYYGKYSTEENIEYLNNSSININLNNFEFHYEGELYGITKTGSKNSSMIYQNIVNGWGGSSQEATFNISAVARYTGNTMTIKWGEDLLYATDKNGNLTKLNDVDYSFSDIFFAYSDPIQNGNGVGIGKDIQAELWIRLRGETEYKLYKSGTIYDIARNSNFGGSSPFENELKDQVVGFYFIMSGINESFNLPSVRVTVKFNKKDIPQSGELHNFTYFQVYFEDEEGNLSLQNEPDRNSYASYITQEIADYDLDTYGTYMQRATGKDGWHYYTLPTYYFHLYPKKQKTDVTQDIEKERFTGSFYLSCPQYSYDTSINKNYIDQYTEEDVYEGFIMYDLLPQGMELESSINDIKNSIGCAYITCNSAYTDGSHDHYDYQSDYTHYHNGYNNYIDYSSYTLTKLDGSEITQAELKDCGKKNTSVDIIENWNNTGRTLVKIKVDLSELQIISTKSISLYYKLDYSVSYDSYQEYGNIYTNKLYVDYLNPKENQSFYYKVNYEKDNLDINENGIKDERIYYTSSEVIITSVISTYQDVQAQVQSTLSNYSTGIVDAEYGKNYSYKLRVRSGQNDITNLIIYDNLERWAKDKDGNFIEAAGKKQYWQGEFLGIDTSYAESKGYTVKVYYSENEKAGTLTEDTSWKEYSDTVDKTKIKSLAFQYLDSEGNPAILPANSLTYVEINMKAPADEKITTLAYNGCWTQWNALDDYGQPVDFITGINSNIVKVALPNSIIDDELPTVTLKFIKEISGTDSDFENMLLDKAEERNFKITLTSLTANEDGSYNQITGLLSSTQGLTLSKVPIGTYLITESDDIYFDFVEMVPNNNEEIIIEGVTLEKTAQGYVLTISDDLSGDVEFNIKVTNKIEPDRPYEDKEEIENLFKIPSVDA